MSTDNLSGNMPKTHEQLCSQPGLFDIANRYPGYKFPCGPKRVKYLDLNKGYINRKSYCGSADWKCKPYPHVCCNQVNGFVVPAGPKIPGNIIVGVCNGQSATKYRGARNAIACAAGPCKKGKCRPEPDKCPCCPRKWYKITGACVAPKCICKAACTGNAGPCGLII